MSTLTFYAAGIDIDSTREFARKQYLDWACSEQIGDRFMVDDELIEEVLKQPETISVYNAIDLALNNAEPSGGYIRIKGVIDESGNVEASVVNPDDSWMMVV